ncbi:pirin family protein [Flammeovirga yaeyamensis]|uniref:Pirin family protein n=1 Tax=Flammeovirga yaeyamensis TaxID=367791 RepID=A0AAX1NA39_9BACT|nr:pirin family protein [Flammeovirga yaeyamensis]MBB3697717.1 redox-sensitive bicupin YhaK (pirin superfamily) [Flammeovirga yaeyamensis]NMF35925.1 pirin family protein [Flammeovirga yaeyamensis]QWG03125.1 pirin family protein [Flammeovirga yaeyamensis]
MKRQLKRKQAGRNGFQYIMDPQTRRELQPFVFFDAGKNKRDDEGMFFGMHPHSGIGIITYFEGGNLVHQDTGNNDDVIRSGGVQWINSGNGIFHAEGYQRPEDKKHQSWDLAIHQLWLQLPPELEEGETGYLNLQPEDLPVVNQVKVIAGEYQGVKSPLNVPYDLTYYDITLKAGEELTIDTPKGQTRGFVFPRTGHLMLDQEEVSLNHLSILEENEGQLHFKALQDTQFVVGLTQPKSYDIVLGGGSIHTNKASFNKAQDNIRKIAQAV